MSKHTPGPWIIWADKNERLQVGPSTNYTVAELYRTPLDGQDANARLIAAAPELLEAATKALGALNALHIQCDVACVVEPEGEIYLRPVINALSQVIAKATGEQS
jgi:hypothetical protein